MLCKVCICAYIYRIYTSMRLSVTIPLILQSANMRDDTIDICHKLTPWVHA